MFDTFENEESNFVYLVNVSYCKKEFFDEDDNDKIVKKQLIVYALNEDEAKEKTRIRFENKLTKNQFYVDLEIDVCEIIY